MTGANPPGGVGGFVVGVDAEVEDHEGVALLAGVADEGFGGVFGDVGEGGVVSHEAEAAGAGGDLFPGFAVVEGGFDGVGVLGGWRRGRRCRRGGRSFRRPRGFRWGR